MERVNLDRFSEPPIRREKPEVDEIDAYKRLRDMELEERARKEVNWSNGQENAGDHGGARR